MARAAEAALVLAVAGAVRRSLPVLRWQRALGATVPVAPTCVPSHRAAGVEAAVGQSIDRAARRLPWHSTCLDQMLAAQLMLRRRRRPGLAVIGLRSGDTAGARWPAHAWLVGDTGTVVGLVADAQYTPVSGFRPPGTPRSRRERPESPAG